MDRQDRRVVGLTMVAHAAFHAYELAIPVFVVAWLDAFGASKAVLGWIVGAGYALVGLGAVPGGLLADRYGSARLLVTSVGGMGLGFLLVGVAPSLLALAGALVCWGGAASVYHPAGLSLLSRVTDGSGTAFAYHGVAGNVGTVVGPLGAAILLTGFDWRAVALAFAAPALGLALLATRVRLPGESKAETGVRGDGGEQRIDSLSEFVAESRTLFTGGFAIAFAVVMCYGLYYRGVLTFLPDLLAGLELFDPVTLAGTAVEPSRYVYAGLLFAGGLGQYVGGRATDAVSTERVLSVAFVGLAVLALAFVPASRSGVGPLLAVCGLLGFAVFFVAPVYQVVIAERVASDSHGLSYGYTYLGTFGVGALGAALAGAVLSAAGPATLFAVLAGFAVLAAGLSVRLYSNSGSTSSS